MEYITLNNGILMPKAGYGTWDLRGEECITCIGQALRMGYRLIDTAEMYENETEVGEGMRSSTIPREDIFVTTKADRRSASYEGVLKAAERSMEKMGLTYIDLMLVHEPYPQYKEMYAALEELYRQGILKAIGVSNFSRRQYDSLMETCSVVPMVNQVESHVYYPQLSYAEYLLAHGTVMESWGPFTEGKRDIFNEPVLVQTAMKHGKSAAQAALRYLLQNDIVVIPKSARESRMKENLDLFDFELDEEDLELIRQLDERESLFHWYD